MASLLANGISLFSPQSSIETSKPLKGFVPRIETLKTLTSHFPNSSRLFKIRANVGKTIPSDQTSLTVFQSPRPTGTWSNRIGTSLRCFSALTPELKTNLDKVVTSNKVVLFMKGTKDFPQCGFSNTCVQILKSLNVPFETLNILENELLRQALKEYSNWPTFPQLYIDGEFFGGCDITVESYKTGELQEVLEKAMCS